MLIWFAETTIVAAGLAGVAAMVGRSRAIGPTARHLLWLAVVIRMVTPPVAAWPWAVRWDELGPDASIMVGREAGPASVSLESVIAVDSIDDPSLVDTLSFRERVERALILAWLTAGAGMAVVQARRVIRFRRRLRLAVPAPQELVDETRRVAGALGVRMPEALVVPGIASPMLWCLGRPRLLIPSELVGAIDAEGWRGILAHELAHLRRRDHWVCRLEMIAGLAWWWNPLYRLARARLDAEAELACDAWVVRTLPEGRLAYAEALFLVGSRSSRSVIPAPVLGAVGAGYLLERRLLMIVREHAGSQFSTLASMAAVLLGLAASPSWSMAARDDDRVAIAIALDDDEKAPKADVKGPGKPEVKVDSGVRVTAKSRPGGALTEIFIRIDGDDPDFAKKLEAIGKELDSKLGPGSDFEKQMKGVELKLRSQIGPGSDLEKHVRRAGDEARAEAEAAAREAKAKAEAALRKAEEAAKMDLERAQDRAEWARKMKAKGYVSEATLKAEELVLKKVEAAQAKAGALKAENRARALARRRLEAKIAAMEAQIRELGEAVRKLDDDDNR